MIKIKKLGKTQYGEWASFEFITDLMVVNGIARHNLELEEDKIYTNLCLVINQRNDKIKFKIVEKKK